MNEQLEAYNYYQHRSKIHKYHRVRRMLDTIGWTPCGLSIKLSRGWSVSALGRMKWPEDWQECKTCAKWASQQPTPDTALLGQGSIAGGR